MAAPTVLAIDTASGPPGTMVVLTGTNFNDTVSAVAFGAYSAGSNFTVIDEVTIVAYAPAGTGTSLNVTVTNSDGTGTLTSGWSYDTEEGGPGGGGGSAPTVSDLSTHTSASDDEQGGDSVTITGTKFTTAIYVWFGDTAASFTVSSDTSIVAIAPPGTGTVDVDVENPFGRSAEPGDPTANNFTYPLPAAPTISTVAPAAGTINTVVTITGDNFSTASVVYFDVYTAAFQILSDESIRAYAPEGPTAGTALTVSVVTRGGTATKATAFTYLAAIADLTATAGVGNVTLNWSPIASSSPVMYEVYGNDGVTPPTTLRTTTSQTTVSFQQDNADGDWYYGVKVVDIFGNKSAMSNIVAVTSTEVIADTIAAGAIDAMNLFVSTIRPVEVVGSLPALPDTNYPNGATVLLTTDSRLYRNAGGGPNTNTHASKATWYDRTANNYDATLSNFTWDSTSGWCGAGTPTDTYVLRFDGSGDHVDCPSGLNSLPTDKTATIEVWFKATTATSSYLAGFWYSSTTRYWALNINSTSRLVSVYKDSVGTNFVISSGTGWQNIFDGKWHHGCAVLNGTTLSLYYDGLLLAERTDLTAGTLEPDATIMGMTGGSTGYYNGDIACVRFYSDNLSATEVATNHATGPTGTGYVTHNLAAHYSAKYALESDAWISLVDPMESGSPITGSQITGNSITAGSIAAGAISTDELAADAIMARSLFIGNFDNLITNPMSEFDTTNRNVQETSPEYEYRGVTTTNPYAGSQCRRLIGVASGDTTMAITRLIPVIPGEKYYCEARCRLGTATGHGHIKLVCYKADGTTEVSTSPARTDAVTVDAYPTDAIKVKDGSSNPWYTIPDGGGTAANAGAYIQVFLETTDAGINNYLYADNLFLRRMNEGSLIVDGEILGQHIKSAQTITSPVITGGTFSTTPTSGSQHVAISSGANANVIELYPNLTSDVPGRIRSDDNASTHAYLEIVPPLVDDGVTPAEIQLWSTSTASGVVITSESVSIAGSGGYPSITLTGGTTDDIYVSASSSTYIKVDSGDDKIYTVGALWPEDWGGTTTMDGIWIQDKDTAANRWKLYFSSSGTPKYLIVHDTGTTYYHCEMTT